MTKSRPLEGRLALVTGASRGLGRAVSVALAKAGAHVIASARTNGALEDLDDEIRALGGQATLLTLDLRKGDTIDALGPTIFERWGKLDIAVLNAALLGPLSPLSHITADTWQLVMDVNVNANWRLIRTLDPLLKRSDAGRVIVVSSSAQDGHNAYWGPYAVSKAALETLARTYAVECQNTAVGVSIVNPGAMRTGMRAKAFPGEDPKTLPEPAEIAPLFVELASPEHRGTGQTIVFREWKAQQRNKPKAIRAANDAG
ncbi:MAG: SDR family NAD(P)-dependent oxidoreductase [Hyphomicrobium sp.]|nr:SDR family NAD(P)-dependent oxidoreductase [Hyphomicrobium sp.]